MKEIGYEEGQKLKLTHVCGVCGECLEVAWGGAFGIAGYVLRCGLDFTHEGIVKPSKSKVVPLYIQNNIERKEKREMEEKIGKEGTTAIAQYRGITSLTKEEATHILQTCWPEAPPIEIKKAALICASYALNPLMHHLYLVEFKGREGSRWAPILGIGATRLIASRKQEYGYADGPRKMTDTEQESIRGEIDPSNIWAITVLTTPSGLKAPGYGCWPKGKEPHGVDKGNTKLNMAMIRSERNAFDRLLPGEMPANIEVGDAQYSDEAATVNNTKVIEVEAKVVEEENPAPKLTEPYKDKDGDDVSKASNAQKEALKRMLGMDDNNFTNAIRGRFGDESLEIKDLTKNESGEWIKELQKGNK